MIGGQAADLCGGPAGIRNLKTAGLMKLTMIAGPVACGATAEQIQVLACCGQNLGEAYQLIDDIRDRLPLGSQCDKTLGQDERHGRSSIYGQLGLDGCHARLIDLVSSVRSHITDTFAPGEPRDLLVRILEQLFLEAVQ